MKIAIRYYSKTGNTKKLAEAIGQVAGVKAETVEVPLTQKVDVLFLGSSVYAAGIDTSVKEFIQNLHKEQVGRIINFSTAALLPSTYKQVAKLLKKRGMELDQQEFHCRGSFQRMHKGKPDENDLEAVRSFTKNVLK